MRQRRSLRPLFFAPRRIDRQTAFALANDKRRHYHGIAGWRTGASLLGAPMFAPDHIPLCRQSAEFYTAENINGSFAALSLGNPHAVFFVDDIKTTELRQTGASLNLETDVFPQGVNVGFCVIVIRRFVCGCMSAVSAKQSLAAAVRRRGGCRNKK